MAQMRNSVFLFLALSSASLAQEQVLADEPGPGRGSHESTFQHLPPPQSFEESSLGVQPPTRLETLSVQEPPQDFAPNRIEEPLPFTDEEPQFDACQEVADGSLFKPIGEIRTTLTEDGQRMPPDCAQQFFVSRAEGARRRFQQDRIFHWKPTNFSHMPAYFDDVPLERYGQTRNRLLQPLLSGGRFALQVPALPYKMGHDRPHACVTTLGHQPPGNCLPCIKQTMPWSSSGSFVQAATTVGLVFLLP